MAAPVPPVKEFVLLAWARAFAIRLGLTPSAFGVLAADCTALVALVDDYEARLKAAHDPSTRTKAAVTQKNTSKTALLARLRQLIRTVNGHVGVSDAQRVELGLNVRDVAPTPIPAPTTKPMLSVDPDGTLRLVDETMPDRKAKPAGVRGAVVLVKIDGEAPAGPDDAKFACLATKFRVALPLPAGASKKTLYVMARWFNERGELGPCSAVASTAIAA